MVTAAFYDPGGMVDRFGMLTTEINTREILLTDARSWGREKTPNFNYEMVKQKIHFFNQRFRFDYNVVEANNTGTPVIHGLIYQYKMRVLGITTGRITTEKARRNGRIMDKDKTVEWINTFRERSIIKFPINMTEGLYELKAELDSFGAKKTKSGKVTYEALSGHDDLVSCVKLAVHFAKMKYLKLPDLFSIQKFDGAAGEEIYDESVMMSREDKIRRNARALMGQKPTPFDKMDVRMG